MVSMLSYLTSLKDRNSHDLLEVFGGKSGATRVAIRRHLNCGVNQDLTSGIDLSLREERKALKHYVQKYQPKLILMGPPCTAFGAWSGFNATMNPAAHQESLRKGLPLANLAAWLALFQLASGRHFICENPWTSKLWQLPLWQKVLRDPRVFWSYADQCMWGLVDQDGDPTKKPTAFVCSDEQLADDLHRACDGSHKHSQLAGSLHGMSKTAFAQIWPDELCEAIVQAVIKLLHRMRYRQQAYPQDASASADGVCPACKQHAARDDSRHNRGKQCRFPNDVSVDWSCPGCAKHQHVSAPLHNKLPGQCRWATTTTRSRATKPAAAVPEDLPDLTVPPVSPMGQWEHVRAKPLLLILERTRQREGWHKEEFGPVHVAWDSAQIRTPEPRFQAETLPRRTVFGMFPELEGTGWWRLQNNVVSSTAGNVGFPVPVLTIMFHADSPLDGSASDKNNGEERWYDKPDAELERKWYNDADDEPSKATSSNPLRGLMDKWDKEEEEEEAKSKPSKPSAIQPYRPILDPPAGEDGNEPVIDQLAAAPEEEQQVAVIPDWSSFDLGRALRTLRSDSTPHILKTLRQLHLRWWHCSESRMTSLLRAAGLPKLVLDRVAEVVKSCRICRLWSHTGHASIASTRLSTEFNMVVQVDLVFLGKLIVLHIIDEATRFSGGAIVKDKSAASLLVALARSWFRVFGAPTTLLSDHESALCGEEAAIFFERWHVVFRPKPVGTHAYVVERHNAILRTAYHHIRSQLELQQLVVDDEDLISEIFFSKNCMLQVYGKSPYQAVIGRTPPALQEFEQQPISAVDDQLGGRVSQNTSRLRELALQSIVEGTAQDRAKRALTTQARPSAESFDYKVGESVDVFRTPANKDAIGWRGPCQIVNVSNISEGYIEVRFHGRAISVRLQDARRSLVYVTLMDTSYPQLLAIQMHIHKIHNSFQTLAVIHDASGWLLTKHARENLQVFRAGLFVGQNTFHLSCLGIRIGCGVNVLPGMSSVSNCVLLWYPKSEPAAYKTLIHEGSDRIIMKHVMGDDWASMHWMQFLSAEESDRKEIRLVVPDEPMLAEDPQQGPMPMQPPHWPPPPPDAEMNEPDTDMKEDDDIMPDPPPHFPPGRPPVRANNSAHKRTESLRSRTPVPTNETIKSIHTDTTENTLPEGWQREHRQPGLVPKRVAGPARGTRHTTGGASASGHNAPAAHVPVLPFADPTDQAVPNLDQDLISKVKKTTQPPKLGTKAIAFMICSVT